MGWLSNYAEARSIGDYQELSDQYKREHKMETNATPTIKFIHLRRCQPTVGMTKDCVWSGITASPYGGVTLAYRDMENGDYQVALGRCRNDERYVRKFGRDAAIRNLLVEGKIIHIAIKPEDALFSKDAVMAELVQYAERHAHRNLKIVSRIKHQVRKLPKTPLTDTLEAALGARDDGDN